MVKPMSQIPHREPPPEPTAENRWQRFKQRPRWLRWLVCGGGAVTVLGVVGTVSGPRDDNTARSVTEVATTVTTTAPATTESVTTAAPTTVASTTVASTTVAPTTATPTTFSEATTVAPTTDSSVATTVPGSLSALDVLALIPVENEHGTGYDRGLFGYPTDADGDSCNTREEVLIRDSLSPAQVDPSGCKVIAGNWLSIYDGKTVSDPAELEIDHVVALKEAWDSGAWSWDRSRQEAFGNDLDDPRSLRAQVVQIDRPTPMKHAASTYHPVYYADSATLRSNRQSSAHHHGAPATLRRPCTPQQRHSFGHEHRTDSAPNCLWLQFQRRLTYQHARPHESE